MEFELPVDDVKRGITAADQSAASGELAFNGIVIVLMLHLCKLVTENFQSFARKKKKTPLNSEFLLGKSGVSSILSSVSDKQSNMATHSINRKIFLLKSRASTVPLPTISTEPDTSKKNKWFNGYQRKHIRYCC